MVIIVVFCQYSVIIIAGRFLVILKSAPEASDVKHAPQLHLV